LRLTFGNKKVKILIWIDTRLPNKVRLVYYTLYPRLQAYYILERVGPYLKVVTRKLKHYYKFVNKRV